MLDRCRIAADDGVGFRRFLTGRETGEKELGLGVEAGALLGGDEKIRRAIGVEVAGRGNGRIVAARVVDRERATLGDLLLEIDVAGPISAATHDERAAGVVEGVRHRRPQAAADGDLRKAIAVEVPGEDDRAGEASARLGIRIDMDAVIRCEARCDVRSRKLARSEEDGEAAVVPHALRDRTDEKVVHAVAVDVGAEDRGKLKPAGVDGVVLENKGLVATLAERSGIEKEILDGRHGRIHEP